MEQEKKSVGQFLTVGENRFRYFDKGEGEPVLFLHSLGQAMYTFRKNAVELSKHCRTICVDLIGHGLSEKPDCGYTIDDFTNSVIDFLDTLEIQSVTLVGFSVGAMIAMNIAEKYPDRVKRLVLLSPGGITKDFPSKIYRLKNKLYADFSFTFFNRRMIKSVLKEMYYNPSLANKEVVNHYHKVLSDEANRESLIAAVTSWDDAEIYEGMPSITVPVYVFWGENDVVNPMKNIERYETDLADVYVGTFALCGHALHEERYRELNKKLIEIVSSND